MKERKKRTGETLTVQEVAEILRISRDKVYKLIDGQRIPTVQGLRPFRIPEAQFRKLTGLRKVAEE